MEQIWMTRNKILKGDLAPDWKQLSKTTYKSHTRYWRGHLNVSKSAHKSKLHRAKCTWTPPLIVELKMNFDAAFKDGKTTIGVVLRDHNETILGAWTYHFGNDNAYCAEAEAAVQALKIGNDLMLDKVIFEGDAMFVILAIQEVQRFEEWRARAKILEGRCLLKAKNLWFLNHVSRECNASAYQLAN